MTDAPTPPNDTSALGVTFQNKNQNGENAEKKRSELYERPLSSLSKTGTQHIKTSFNVSAGLSGKASEEGTFVSDRKHDHLSFFQTIRKAFSEWKTLHAKNVHDDTPETPTISLKKESTEIPAPAKEVRPPQPAKVAPSAFIPEEKIIPPPQTTSAPPEKNLEKKSSAVSYEAFEKIFEEPNTPASPKEGAYKLQKIRTLKTDTALLASDVLPVSEKHPEPEKIIQQSVAPKVVSQKPLEKISVTPLDVRSTMVAPEISERISEKEFASLAPEKQKTETTDAPIVRSVPHTPDVSIVSEKSPGHTPADIIPQWTHTSDTRAATETQKSRDETPSHPSEHEETFVIPPTHEIAQTISNDSPLFETPSPVVPEFDSVPPFEERAHRVQERMHNMQTSLSHEGEEQTAREETTTYTDLPLSTLSRVVKPEEQEEAKIESHVSEVVAPPASVEEDTLPETQFHTTMEAVQETETAVPVENPTPHVSPIPAPLQKTSPASPSPLRFALPFVLVCVALVVFGAGGVFLFKHMKQESDTVPPPSETTSAPSTEVPPSQSQALGLSGDPSSFLTQMQDAVTHASPGITEFSVLDSQSSRTATAQELFAFLNSTMPPRTIRALEPVFSIGSVTTTKNEFFLVIRSNNFDALFSGMLAWEPSLYTEFSPLFGTATDTAAFTDAVQNNKSVRILRAKDGSERVVYSFIDNRTVVITQSSDALAKLLTHF